MPTQTRGRQIKDDDVGREDINVTTVGRALATKVQAGTNIGISYTGADVGTGDVTVGLSGVVGVGNGGTGVDTLTGVVIGNATSAFTSVAGTSNQVLRRNTANTAYEFYTLPASVLGTIAAGQVAFGTDANTIGGDTDFTYNSTTNLLTLGGGITLTGAQTIQTSTGNLTLATAAGNGNILLSPNGTGNVGINNSAPSVALEVAGTGASGVIRSLRTTGAGALSVSDHAGRISLGTSSGSAAFIGAQIGILADATWTSGTSQPSSFVISNVSSGTTLTEKLRVYSTGNVVIQNGGTFTDSGFRLDVNGSTRFNGLSTIQGTAASDSGQLGAELLTTGTGDASWTGTSFATGYTHVVGSTTTLTSTLAGVVNTFYQITYTVTGRTAGSFTIAFGGESFAGLTATGAVGPRATTTGTLVITPTTDFNGTIVLSIRVITASSASVTFNSSAGATTNQIRISNNANTFIGLNAGRSNTTGVNNTFVGSSAGVSNTTGNSNSFFGISAGRDNTTASSNSFFGSSSGLVNTTGVSNSFFGASSGQANTTGGSNSFFGNASGFANTTGTSNSFFGINSGLNNTTGGLNSFFGTNAGRFLADGTTALTIANDSVFIGAGTRANANNQTNQIVIGITAIGLGSNTTVLGNTSTTFGRWYGSLLLGTTTNVASSILTMVSTTQGFLPPRMTTTQRNAIASPATGLVVYDTTLNDPFYFNGTAWTMFQDAITLTTTGTSGAATLVGTTLNIPQYQAALTNPVTGTGTSGQVAYFNGTSSITGETNLFWDATNDRLGIGTASPSGRLDVSNTGDLYTNLVTSGNNTSAVLSLFNSTGVTDGAAICYNVAMRFGTVTGLNGAGFTERMRITAAGRVLIGNPPPAESTFTLDVNGTGRFSGTLRNDAATGFGIGSIAGLRRIQYDLANTRFGLLTDGDALANLEAAAATFSSSVSVGADLTLSAANPFVYGGTAAGSVGLSNIGGQTYVRVFGASHATTPNVTQFVNSGSTSLTIASTGAATFGSSISTAGNINASYADIKLFTYQNIAGQYKFIGTEYAPGNGNNRAEIRFGIDGSDTRTKISFHVANGIGTINEALSIGYTGAATFSSSVTATNLYLGSLTNEQLMISGTGSRGIGVSTTTSGDPYFRLYNNTTIVGDMWWGRSGNFQGINSLGVGSITAINPFGGIVGIGTASPATLLHVRGTGEVFFETNSNTFDPALRIQKSRGTAPSRNIVANEDYTGSITFEAYNGTSYSQATGILGQVNGTVSTGITPTDLIFSAGPSGTTRANERMRIFSSGNVRIGSSAFPDSGDVLRVGGNTYTQNIITFQPGNVQKSVQWKLGAARGGTVTTNATVRVEIDGVLVDLVARYV
jgi:hypothetical protein